MIDRKEMRAIAMQFFSFCTGGVRIDPLGKGNINDTFLATGERCKFVLQRLNAKVFPEPAEIVYNQHKIAAFLKRSGRLSVASPLLTDRGEPFVVDSCGGVWRAQEYINFHSCVCVDTPEQARSLGEVLGRLHTVLASFPVDQLAEPLPGFHDLSQYVQEFETLDCEKKTRISRSDSFCLEMIARFRVWADFFTSKQVTGQLKTQPVHGDPKCDNFIFTGSALASGMLDLDTVGPGLVQYDVGDCLRSCCNTGGVEGKDAGLHNALYSAVLSGYFSEAEDVEFVYEAVLLVSFELGLRFYIDHLRGNCYFRVIRDGDNLLRSRRQFQLVQDIVDREHELRHLVELARRCL